jgi:hypothetical protein
VVAPEEARPPRRAQTAQAGGFGRSAHLLHHEGHELVSGHGRLLSSLRELGLLWLLHPYAYHVFASALREIRPIPKEKRTLL